MANLKALKNAKTPTGGSINLLSVNDHLKYFLGFIAFLGLGGLAVTSYNKLKSTTGVSDLQEEAQEAMEEI